MRKREGQHRELKWRQRDKRQGEREIEGGERGVCNPCSRAVGSPQFVNVIYRHSEQQQAFLFSLSLSSSVSVVRAVFICLSVYLCLLLFLSLPSSVKWLWCVCAHVVHSQGLCCHRRHHWDIRWSDALVCVSYPPFKVPLYTLLSISQYKVENS